MNFINIIKSEKRREEDIQLFCTSKLKKKSTLTVFKYINIFLQKLTELINVRGEKNVNAFKMSLRLDNYLLLIIFNN